jgi:hypothetical protein
MKVSYNDSVAISETPSAIGAYLVTAGTVWMLSQMY